MEKEELSSISFQPWRQPNSCSLFIYFHISLVTQAAARCLTPACSSRAHAALPTLPCPGTMLRVRGRAAEVLNGAGLSKGLKTRTSSRAGLCRRCLVGQGTGHVSSEPTCTPTPTKAFQVDPKQTDQLDLLKPSGFPRAYFAMRAQMRCNFSSLFVSGCIQSPAVYREASSFLGKHSTH